MKRRKPRVEIGTIEHSGRKFSALGSVVDTARGRVSGYVGSGTVPGYGSHVRPLTSWDGKTRIGVIWPKSSWSTPRSPFSSKMYAYEAEIDGRRYSGRGMGEGMVVHLKRRATRKKRRS